MSARYSALYKLALVLCGDGHRAEDIVQSALLKAYTAWPRVSRAGMVDAYVRRIVVNSHIDEHRRPWRRESNLTDELLTRPNEDSGLSVMNWYGVRVSGRVQLIIAATLAVLLSVATVVSLPHATMANLTPFAPHGWTAIAPAAALLIWAFAGWEVVTSLSSEYRNPARDITRATAVALVVMGVMYLGVAFATVAVLGDSSSKAPLSDLLVLGFGEPARGVTTVVAVLLSLGAMNAYFAGSARLGGALGRDGSLPPWFARGSSAGEVPRRSLAVVAATTFLTLLTVIVTGIPIEHTMLLVTGAVALVYVIGTAAALRLLPRGTWVHRSAGRRSARPYYYSQ